MSLLCINFESYVKISSSSQSATSNFLLVFKEFGVFTRKVIPKRTRFGPLEGIMTDDPSGILPSTGLIYSVLIGEETFFLDVSDEGLNNFVIRILCSLSHGEMWKKIYQYSRPLISMGVRNHRPLWKLKLCKILHPWHSVYCICWIIKRLVIWNDPYLF